MCKRSANGKPGRIGIIETEKLIELANLDRLRQKYGRAIALQQRGDRLTSQFFPDITEANHHFNSLKDRTGVTIRDSNLEDIFVELTGHQLS